MSVRHEEETIHSGLKTRIQATAAFPGRAAIQIHVAVAESFSGAASQLPEAFKQGQSDI